jgi:glycosyltransferase involved in cell wall biosynthesis
VNLIMNIIFISTMTDAPWGGSEELWSQAAHRLTDAGHNVSALTERWTPLSEKLVDLQNHGVKLRLRDSSRGALAKAVFKKLTGSCIKDSDYRWLLDQEPDLVVISQGGIKDGLASMTLCRQTKLPYLSIVQCNSDYAWQTDVVAAQLATAYRNAVQVCCVSKNNLELLEEQIGEALPNARVVWNPNNIAGIGLLPWPLDDGIVRLACVARLEPGVKGQDILFKVLARPEWRKRTVEINLFGGGACEHSLRQMVADLHLDRINFHGHVKGISGIWQKNHLLLLPSRQEGMPLALIEAMSCGRPAVLTDVGGNAELCRDGETGFIASAAAEIPFANALERAWSHRFSWPAMGLAAHQRITKLVPKDPISDFCELINKYSHA